MNAQKSTTTPDQMDALVALAEDLFHEAERCAQAGLWRAAILAIGGSVEAAIVATASRLEPQLRESGVWPRKQDPLKWQLGEATDLARNAGWFGTSAPASATGNDMFEPLQGEIGDAVRFLVSVRNMLVHPGAYVRAEVHPDFADADHMKPTYDILSGITADVLGHLTEALRSTSHDSSSP
jgi:hypothetical protein